MSTLGSIFSSQDTAEGGIPLAFEVRVPPQALGHPDGIWVEIPLALPTASGDVARVVAHPPDGAWVPLRLPDAMPDGTRLRLRGQGGRDEAGQVGPLVLTIRVDPQAPLYHQPGHALATTSVTPARLAYFVLGGLAGLVVLQAMC